MGENQGQGWDESYEISEDLSAKKFFVMKQGAASGAALLADTAGGVVLGTLQETGRDGSSQTVHALIRGSGESLCKVGDTIALDDPLQADTDGMAKVATTADYVFARALETGVDGDVIRVKITHEGTF